MKRIMGGKHEPCRDCRNIFYWSAETPDELAGESQELNPIIDLSILLPALPALRQHEGKREGMYITQTMCHGFLQSVKTNVLEAN